MALGAPPRTGAPSAMADSRCRWARVPSNPVLQIQQLVLVRLRTVGLRDAWIRHILLYTIAGQPSNEWQDHRTEFGPIFTF